MSFNYLVVEPSLRMDDLNLLATFEKFRYSNLPSTCLDDNFWKKMKGKMNESDAFARLAHMIISKYSSSSKSSHHSSSSPKSYHDSSKHHSPSYSKSYH